MEPRDRAIADAATVSVAAAVVAVILPGVPYPRGKDRHEKAISPRAVGRRCAASQI